MIKLYGIFMLIGCKFNIHGNLSLWDDIMLADTQTAHEVNSSKVWASYCVNANCG